MRARFGVRNRPSDPIVALMTLGACRPLPPGPLPAHEHCRMPSHSHRAEGVAGAARPRPVAHPTRFMHPCPPTRPLPAPVACPRAAAARPSHPAPCIAVFCRPAHACTALCEPRLHPALCTARPARPGPACRTSTWPPPAPCTALRLQLRRAPAGRARAPPSNKGGRRVTRVVKLLQHKTGLLGERAVVESCALQAASAKSIKGAGGGGVGGVGHRASRRVATVSQAQAHRSVRSGGDPAR